MGATHLSGLSVGQLSSGAYTKGSEVKYVEQGSVTVTPGLIGANTSGDTVVAIANAKLGDMVEMNPPATALAAGLVKGQVWVSANGSVTVRIGNLTAGGLTPASGSWAYTLISPTAR